MWHGFAVLNGGMPDQLDSRTPPEVRRPRAAKIASELLGNRSEYTRFVRLAASRMVNPSEAEDVVQSAAASFIQSFDPFGPESKPIPYFVTAVLGHAAKANRALARHPERYGRARLNDETPLVEAQHDEGSGEVLDLIAGGDVAKRVMAALPPRERMLIGMQQLGFERDEIAAALDVSDRGLRKIITRARGALRGELEAEELTT